MSAAVSLQQMFVLCFNVEEAEGAVTDKLPPPGDTLLLLDDKVKQKVSTS